jgi:signal transduction histidine kinase
MKSFRIPIRIKILVTVLLAVTGVVSVITVTMARLFHEDKKTYINDLVSMTAQSAAAEFDALLRGYRQRVELWSRVMEDENLPMAERERLARSLFQGFPELISVTLYRGSRPALTISDSAELEVAGLTSRDLEERQAQWRLPTERLQGGALFVESAPLCDELPAARLSFVTDADGGAVAALIRLDPLLAVAARGGVFDVALALPDGTLLAHRDVRRVASRSRTELVPEVRELGRAGRGGFTTSFAHDGQDRLGGFAAVASGGLVASATVPETAAVVASRDLLAKLSQVALALLAAASILGLLWAYRLTRPLERLSTAARDIGEGRFDVTVEVPSADEIGDLSVSFNRMTRGLRERDDALRAAHTQLIQSEKLAAFGQLGAGIAHEVKNPLAGILGCAQIALKKADPGSMLHTNLQLIEKETRRCKSIIDNLLRFARQEKTSLEPTSVNVVVEDAVAIVRHQMEMHRVHLETELASDLPEILANANQLQQVVMNLAINAQQAMEDTPGQITIVTRRSAAGAVEIAVRDTGPGMTREILDKIFEPFFTTKPSGKGTGLGLSVSFGIVKDHAGEIAVDSAPGRGTTFVITLPAHEVQGTTVETAGVAVGA